MGLFSQHGSAWTLSLSTSLSGRYSWVWVTLFSQLTGGMASSCTREGSGWTSRRISSLEGWLSIRTDCAEMWWSHYPWKILWNVWTWYFVLCFYSHGGVWSKVGLKHFGALSSLSSLPILLFSLTQDQYTLEKVRPIWNDCYCFPNCTDCPKSAQTSL